MNWNLVNIYCSGQATEPVTGALFAIGITNVEIVDGIEDVKSFFDTAQKRWDYIDYGELEQKLGAPCVRVYLPTQESGLAQLAALREAMQTLKTLDLGMYVGSLEIQVKEVADEDWANNWKQYFSPIAVGKRTLILPAWEQAPQTDRVIYTMDNCALFGTGQHQSTQFCLEQLETHLAKGDRILDIGAGSGILSIVGMKLGAGKAVAVELEPHAKEVIAQNALRNGIDLPNCYQVIVGDALSDPATVQAMGTGYDIVLANIVASVIIHLAPTAFAALKPGGIFITSGIIDERLEEVKQALVQAGFTLLHQDIKAGWCVLCATR